MTTAFVLSGGANLGAVQVGMLRALDEADIRPDLLVGASVGAINAAWVAGAPAGAGVEPLADIWRRLRRQDVFPLRFGRGLAGFLGKRPSLFGDAGLRRTIDKHVVFDRIEDARIPLHVVVTDVLDGRDVAISSGPAVDVITASAAVPGVLPPVVLNGRVYMDGGVMNNAPISHAVALGADRIYVLPTGYACSLTEAPTSALGMTMHALSLMVNRRLSLEVEHFHEAADLRVVPPPCPIDVGPNEFDRADELIEIAYANTVEWLGASAGALSISPMLGSGGGNPLADHDRRHSDGVPHT